MPRGPLLFWPPPVDNSWRRVGGWCLEGSWPRSLSVGCWSGCGRQGAVEPALSSSSSAAEVEPALPVRIYTAWNPGQNVGSLGLALHAHPLSEWDPWLLTATTFLWSMIGGPGPPRAPERGFSPCGPQLVKGPTFSKDQDACPKNRFCFGIFFWFFVK